MRSCSGWLNSTFYRPWLLLPFVLLLFPDFSDRNPSMSQPNSSAIRRVAIIGGNRIPFARSNSVYSYASNQDMLTAAMNGLINRYHLQGERIGEVIAGAVIKHSRDFNLARETVLSTALDPHTPAVDIQQACGTGLQAIIMAANKIALG